MTDPEQLTEMLLRLEIEDYSKSSCAAAINGQRVPQALGLRLARLCTIRGIRYNPGFATELMGISPLFTRALKAREVMSNKVPASFEAPEDIPYCIWHPDIATEDTYRELVEQYPVMRYQVGRACAAGGYTKLYKELDILPDVSIAEEARACGSTEIFEHIMSKPLRYKVMDDYERSIATESLEVAYLNGDTAVRQSLDDKQEFETPEKEDEYGFYETICGGPGFDETAFNVTEDLNIDISKIDTYARRLDYDDTNHRLLVQLLTGPLPSDLPTVNKDLLICMAAYHGDIDRYTRLRRPKMVENELSCCSRGVYHNTMFAVWWSRQNRDFDGSSKLTKAICARFIMNNVVIPSAFEYLPYLIWYPTVAKETTYRKLAEIVPNTIPQVLRACMVGGYRGLFDELVTKVQPDDALLLEATATVDPAYKDALERRIAEVGLKELDHLDRWKLQTHHKMAQSDHVLCKSVDLASKYMIRSDAFGNEGTLSEGHGCNAGAIELLACLPEEWRLPMEEHGEDEGDITLDYSVWPRRTAVA